MRLVSCLVWLLAAGCSSTGARGSDANASDLAVSPKGALPELPPCLFPVAAARSDSKRALRVRPGDPAASFLVDKLTGALRPREGKQMPLAANTGAPLVPSPLPADFIERTLKPWMLRVR